MTGCYLIGITLKLLIYCKKAFKSYFPFERLGIYFLTSLKTFMLSKWQTLIIFNTMLFLLVSLRKKIFRAVTSVLLSFNKILTFFMCASIFLYDISFFPIYNWSVITLVTPWHFHLPPSSGQRCMLFLQYIRLSTLICV